MNEGPPPRGWSLLEARDMLCDQGLLARYLEAEEAERCFTGQRYDYRYAIVIKFVDGGRPTSRNKYTKFLSQEFAPVYTHRRRVGEELIQQFKERLSCFAITARQGDSVVTGAEVTITPEAFRYLELKSWDPSELVEKVGGTEIRYRAIRIVAEEALPRVHTVPVAQLDPFLTKWVSNLSPGDKGLTEDSLQQAAEREFPQYKVSRDRVRSWIADKMPPEKRFQRGYKPQSETINRYGVD